MDYYVTLGMMQGNATIFRADGLPNFGNRCTPQEDGTFLLEYTYQSYAVGGADRRKTTKRAEVVLTPGKSKIIPISETQWERVKGCYNAAFNLVARVVTANEAYAIVDKKRPGYALGQILISLGKEDEFCQTLNKFKEPSDEAWSIYDSGKYEMLALAYQYGIGREKDERKALLNAFRSFSFQPPIPFIAKGYGKKSIGSVDDYVNAVREASHKGSEYVLGLALIEEGFQGAGESRILWAGDTVAFDPDDPFHDEAHQKEREFQCAIHLEAAKICVAHDKWEKAQENYGSYLAYREFGDDRKIHFEAKEWDDDPYDPSSHTYNYTDMDQCASLIRVAAGKGDEIAKKIEPHLMVKGGLRE